MSVPLPTYRWHQTLRIRSRNEGLWHLVGQGLTQRSPVLARLADAQIVNVGSTCHVLLTDAHSTTAVKLVRPRSIPRDRVRKYFQCQSKREYAAMKWMRACGIPVIDVWGYGWSFNPNAEYESLLVMQYLHHRVNARRYLEDAGAAERQVLLGHIAADIVDIYRRGYILYDCHLGNVLVDSSGRYKWIDSELRQAGRRYTGTRIVNLMNDSLRQCVADDERRFWIERLQARLAP